MRYYPLARDFVYLGTESGAIKVLCVFGGSAPTATSSTPDVATSQVAISSFAITPQDMNLTKPGKVVCTSLLPSRERESELAAAFVDDDADLGAIGSDRRAPS